MPQFFMEAKPGVRADYEARLGKFLVGFNALDMMIGELLRRIMIASGKPDLADEVQAKPATAQKLVYLEIALMLPAADEVKDIDMKRLKVLNNERNGFAHGHFAQNILTGSFRIVGSKTGKAKRQAPKGLDADGEIAHEFAHLDDLIAMSDAAYAELMELLISSRFADRQYDDE